MSILLATDIPADERQAWAQALREALPQEHWVEQRGPAADAQIDVAIVANPPPGSLAGLPGLRLVQSLWAGVDRLLADPSLPAGVPLARMVDPAMNTAMAETALWAVLWLQRDFDVYVRQQQAGLWRPHVQRRADDMPVAVLGLGQMGRGAALRLAANGYPVRGWSRGPAPDDEARALAAAGVRCLHGDAALPAVLAAARIVVNLLPLTPATRALFDAARLAQMAPGASLVNLARGAHVVEADLLAALDRGHLRHAVLDVCAQEPLPAGHPFWSHPRLTLLPHIAAQTDLRSAAAIAAANVRALRAGQPLAHLVDLRRGY